MAEPPVHRHVGWLAPAETPVLGPSRRIQLASLAALVALAGLLVVRGLEIDVFNRLRLAGFDLMQRLVPAPPAPSPSAVVVIDIDDRSLAALGRWPWPRDVLAQVVDALDRHQVRLIAFGILLPEAGGTADAGAPAPDEALAAAIARSAAPVVLASALQRVGGPPAAGQPALPPGLALDGPAPLPWVPGAERVIGNLDLLEDAADGRGFLTTIADGDGVVRRLPLLAQVEGALQSGLVLEAVRLAGSANEGAANGGAATAGGAAVATVRTHPLFGVVGIAVGDALIATDRNGALWLNTPSAAAPASRVPVVDLLAGTTDEPLAGRIALIGSTAAGLGDIGPAGRGGVEALAHGIRSALSADPLVRPAYAGWLEILVTLIVGLVLIYRMALYTAVRTAVWAGIIVLVIAGVAVAMLAFAQVLVDPTFPILATLAIAGFVGYSRTREVERSRAAARRSLASAAAFIHRLVDATFDSVIAVDRDGRLLFANRAARALPIFPAEPALGTDVLALLRRADGPAAAGRLRAAELAAADAAVDLIATEPGGDEPVLLEAAATALQGEPSGAVVLVMRDVTARRAAQRRIEAQTRALEAMAEDLRRQTDDALTARTAADSANAAKGEFLMMMSHELRTPLNAVMGFAELMAVEPFGPIGDARYHGYLQDIRASGGQLLAMIDSILEVIRLDGLDPVAHDGAFPLAPVIEECCALMRPEATMKSVALAISAGDGRLAFRGDVALMRHVLVSLLSNAIGLTRSGDRISVSVEAAPGRGLSLTVADTGVGMTEAELDRAMQVLALSGSSMTRGPGGAGVGLALARLATEKQGGRLSLRSVLGQGTTVDVWFPDSRIYWQPSDLQAASDLSARMHRAGAER